ncbi:magnesium transporter CorA family protein [Jatrophihabitans fulvus]
MTQQAPIRTRVWRNGVLERENFPFEQVSDFLEQPDTLVWADLVAPDAHAVAQLAEELSLDPHAVEDALAARERPKASRFATHLFITAYSLQCHGSATDIAVGRISVFCTHKALVTVRLDEAVDIDAVVARWDASPELLKYGTKALLHGVLDEVVDQFFVAIQSLDDDVEQLEDVLFDEEAGSGREVSQRTYALRRSLVQVRRAVGPMREVVATVMRRAVGDDAMAELAPYYEDLYDHTIRASDWTDNLRDMITTVFETNMQLADTRMNTIMKKLTAWAAIIAVPTAVTGWFGQNLPYPGFEKPWGFWLSVVIIVGAAAALYVSFKRRDWF